MSLFKDFEPVTEAQWRQKIQVDLKGADYNDTLVTTTPDGQHIKPIYHRDSAATSSIPSRGTHNGSWFLSQKISVENAQEANAKVHDVLQRGAEGVVLVIKNFSIALEDLFKDLPEHGIQVHLSKLDIDFIKALYDIHPRCYLHIDPIYEVATTGNWSKSAGDDIEDYTGFINGFPGYFSNITINTSAYQQAGATVAQELAYFTAHLNEYLNALENRSSLGKFRPQSGENGVSNPPEKRVNVDTAIGANYFEQIAKYRAYRVLARSLGEIYEVPIDIYITATPSLRNKSVLDYNVNLLRTTTECMSAVLGGADTIHNLRYDDFFNEDNEFGERIARNQLLILKEEAYLDKINNAADGAYFIEALTKMNVEKALQIFKSIESGGGFIAALKSGTIQRKIKESDERERAALKHCDSILVGVNKFQGDKNVALSSLGKSPFTGKSNDKTLIEPLSLKRLAEPMEKAVLE